MTADRGRRRRAELIEAGVALLAEGGWDSVTQRGVAGRAGANPGLVHYYFQGTTGLHVAVAEAAIRRSMGGVADDLLGAKDERALFDHLARALSGLRREQTRARLVAELVGAAFAHPEIGVLVRQQLAGARAQLEQWFAAHHPDWPAKRLRGSAAAFVALADGAALHLTLDPELSARDMSAFLRASGRWQ